MKQILVLGAGLVARPLVRYLLNQPEMQVTVADQIAVLYEGRIMGNLTCKEADTEKLGMMMAGVKE